MFFGTPSRTAVKVGECDHFREVRWHGLKKVTHMDDRHRHTFRMDRVLEHFVDVLLLSKLDIKAVVNMELTLRTRWFEQATDKSRTAPRITAQFHERAGNTRIQDPIDKVMDVGRLLDAQHVVLVIKSREQYIGDT